MKLGNEIDGDSKRSYKIAVWQEKKKSTRIEDRRQCMAGSQEYSFEQTFKEAWPKKI